jgi:hypothetical protein
MNTGRILREEANMFSKTRMAKFLGVAVLLATPLPVLAQSEGYTEPAPGVSRAYGPPSGYGATVELGGGVMNFSGSGARALTNVGGAWDLRLGWGTRSVIGFEAAYVGSANGLNVAGLDSNAVLLGTGAEGNLRLNAPLIYGDTLVEPFAFGGAGWTRFDIVNDDFNTSALQQRDHVLMVPVGGGLAATHRGLLFDARFTYRWAFNEDLAGGTNLDNWIVSANIGSEF